MRLLAVASLSFAAVTGCAMRPPPSVLEAGPYFLKTATNQELDGYAGMCFIHPGPCEIWITEECRHRPIYARRVMAHEMGHSLGLGHDTLTTGPIDPTPEMAARIPAGRVVEVVDPGQGETELRIAMFWAAEQWNRCAGRPVVLVR